MRSKQIHKKEGIERQFRGYNIGVQYILKRIHFIMFMRNISLNKSKKHSTNKQKASVSLQRA